jgi:hypothetical protein
MQSLNTNRHIHPGLSVVLALLYIVATVFAFVYDALFLRVFVTPALLVALWFAAVIVLSAFGFSRCISHGWSPSVLWLGLGPPLLLVLVLFLFHPMRRTGTSIYFRHFALADIADYRGFASSVEDDSTPPDSSGVGISGSVRKIETGPPIRISFLVGRGRFDTWTLAYDPSESLDHLNRLVPEYGDRSTSRRLAASLGRGSKVDQLRRIVASELFGDKMIRCDRIEPSWYFCFVKSAV